MNKLFFLSLVILCCSCSYPVKNVDSRGENIICFGDSITYGVGAKRSEDFPSILSNLLQETVINAGVNGDTTESALKRLKKDVLDKSAYLVIVELGGNDFLGKVPKQKTIKNLSEIIIRIQETGAMVGLADVSAGMFLSGYGSDFKRLAKKTGCIFIPRLLEGIINNPSLKADYIHPNAEGYSIVAQRIYNAIKPYIK